MDAEVGLPPLPVSHIDPAPDLSVLHHKRKRQRFDHDVTTSSDPALFSSDDHAPTAEHYNTKRRKQKWHGTWWGEKFKRRTSSMSNSDKRKFTRNFDSGVWMGSEGTDTSIEDEFLEETMPNHRRRGILNSPYHTSERITNEAGKDTAMLEEVDNPQPSSYTKRPAGAPSPYLDARVEYIINRCLEAGDENIDLSFMALEDVPNESLKRLRSLTKHTVIQDISPSQDAYSPIEPALRLYLSHNSLTIFPSEILNLTNLRLLSLRYNRLTKLPPAIASLPSLEQLNIAVNELQYLPYEMVCLYDREEFGMIAFPNPFQEHLPEHEVSSLQAMQSGEPRRPGLIARSSPQYFRADGSKSRHGPQPPATLSNAPTLLELALQKCQQLPNLIEIQEWCTSTSDGEETGPPTLSMPLALAQEAKAYGGRLKCTICGRSFILPRVQWIEWFYIPWVRMDVVDTEQPVELPRQRPPNDSFLPFLRQGCSWACVVRNS